MTATVRHALTSFSTAPVRWLGSAPESHPQAAGEQALGELTPSAADLPHRALSS